MKRIAIALFIILAAALMVSGCQTAPSSAADNNDGAMMEKTAEAASGDAMIEKTDDARMEDASADDSMIKEEDAMMEKTDDTTDDTMMPEITMMYTGKALAGSRTPYLDFNKKDYDAALAEGKVIILNFYADWCPTCKAEQPDAFAAFDTLNDEKVVGFRVNYKDSQTDADETALAREFGIAYQHTKVVLKDGKMILKSPETWSKDRYISEATKAVA